MLKANQPAIVIMTMLIGPPDGRPCPREKG
jgi:hypothetical protein